MLQKIKTTTHYTLPLSMLVFFLGYGLTIWFSYSHITVLLSRGVMMLSGVTFLLSLIVRLLRPPEADSVTARTGNNQVPGTVDTVTVDAISPQLAEYRHLRGLLLLGSILWLPSAFIVSLGTALIRSNTGGSLLSLAGVFIFICTVTPVLLTVYAFIRGQKYARSGEYARAVQVLKLPFWNLVLVVGYLALSMFSELL